VFNVKGSASKAWARNTRGQSRA